MEENKAFHLLIRLWPKLLLSFLAIAVAVVWSYRLFNSKRSEYKHDYFIAHQIFESFQKGDQLPSESIESIQKILERHPELHPKYDSLLALTLFSQQRTAEALPYANSLLKQAGPQSPDFHAAFGKATVLIAEGQYQEALAAATQLDAELELQPEYPLLEAMNQLRIFFLNDQLGLEEQKKIAWEKLEKHPKFSEVTAWLHQGDLSLMDFHAHH